MIVLVLVVFGLIFGSFINALVWRLHSQMTLREKKQLTKADKQQLHELSILHGRSRCFNCQHQLTTVDLLPVVSWLWLRGKCRYCRASIPDTPVAELLTPIVLVISYLWWPWLLHDPLSWLVFATWGLCIVLFVALLLFDAKWFLLPNRLVFPLIGISLVFRLLLAAMTGDWVSVLLAGLWGVVVLAGLFYVLFAISNEQWIGGGDVKLAVALGLLAGGVQPAFLLLFLASAAGTVAAIPTLLKRGALQGVRVPFGPFLLVATVATVLFSQPVLDWYRGLFGL